MKAAHAKRTKVCLPVGQGTPSDRHKYNLTVTNITNITFYQMSAVQPKRISLDTCLSQSPAPK